MGAVDYWCNDFRPAQLAGWEAAIAAQGIPLRIRRKGDGFAEPATFLARMDEVGVDTVLLPSADVPEHAGPTDYARFAMPPEDVVKLRTAHPGRFAGLWSVEPTGGWLAVARAAEALADPAFVGLHLHTHSFDRRFDDRDLYPFYALAADHDLPMVVQAGSAGGLLASECGRPIGIDRPALYFGAVRFVLSHTGWPWTDEALAMAQKHPNVFLGTAAWPPHHWPAQLIAFLRGVGRGKTLFGTSFPVVGHKGALAGLDALELDAEARDALLGGAARRVFTRLPS